MSGKLQQLFDLQHFAENKKLQSLIDDTMSRYGAGSTGRMELEEDDLDMLFAAGDSHMAGRGSNLLGKDEESI